MIIRVRYMDVFFVSKRLISRFCKRLERGDHFRENKLEVIGQNFCLSLWGLSGVLTSQLGELVTA